GLGWRVDLCTVRCHHGWPQGILSAKSTHKEITVAYVDAVVIPVPKKKLAAYRRMAQRAGKVWRELGALEYVEAVADDVKPGKHTSFPQSVKLKPGEIVVFAHIIYRSRAHRDRVISKVMKDPRLADMMGSK